MSQVWSKRLTVIALKRLLVHARLQRSVAGISLSTQVTTSSEREPMLLALLLALRVCGMIALYNVSN